MILLVVDTQKLIMTNNLYNFDSLVPNIEQLIVTARKNKIEIVYIRHDDGPNTELTEGKEGFEIYEKFQPTTLERIFDKSVNSAFKGTGLLEYLKEKSTKKIVIAGLQTDFCIDATVKCGFEHGFHMIVPAMPIRRKITTLCQGRIVTSTIMNGCGLSVTRPVYLWKKRLMKWNIIDKLERNCINLPLLSFFWETAAFKKIVSNI